MRMKFIGQYTNGRDTITYLNCTFIGHEARNVPDNVAGLLRNNPEFEVVADPKKPAPKKAKK